MTSVNEAAFDQQLGWLRTKHYQPSQLLPSGTLVTVHVFLPNDYIFSI